MMNSKQLIAHDMYKAMKGYLETIKQSYKNFMHKGMSTVHTEMVENFNQQLHYTIGKKYIKVIKGTSVHSFIMIEDDAKFKKGDILMAATWATPARNKARGNVFESYSVDWMGPKYLVGSYNGYSNRG